MRNKIISSNWFVALVALAFTGMGVVIVKAFMDALRMLGWIQ